MFSFPYLDYSRRWKLFPLPLSFMHDDLAQAGLAAPAESSSNESTALVLTTEGLIQHDASPCVPRRDMLGNLYTNVPVRRFPFRITPVVLLAEPTCSATRNNKSILRSGHMCERIDIQLRYGEPTLWTSSGDLVTVLDLVYGCSVSSSALEAAQRTAR